MSDDKPPRGPNDRRLSERYDVSWMVDCQTPDTFLYASITNISAFGIFVRTIEPLQKGTHVTLHFAPPGREPFALSGVVHWVNRVKQGVENPNPGMGIEFVALTPDERERLVDVIRTIAYIREDTLHRPN